MFLLFQIENFCKNVYIFILFGSKGNLLWASHKVLFTLNIWAFFCNRSTLDYLFWFTQSFVWRSLQIIGRITLTLHPDCRSRWWKRKKERSASASASGWLVRKTKILLFNYLTESGHDIFFANKKRKIDFRDEIRKKGNGDTTKQKYKNEIKIER